MATKRRSTKKKKPTAAAAKKARAYRVEFWFDGVAHEAGTPKGTQTQRPGWKPRGTYASRKLAVAHRKSIERSERVSTRIIPVSA